MWRTSPPLRYSETWSTVRDPLLVNETWPSIICLKHSATLILPPLLKPPSRRTCLITISKLFFTALPIPSSDTVCVCVCVCVCACTCVCACVHACMCVCVCVVSVIVKHPVLPPSVVDGRSRNPLYYYYYYLCGGLPLLYNTLKQNMTHS